MLHRLDSGSPDVPKTVLKCSSPNLDFRVSSEHDCEQAQTHGPIVCQRPRYMTYSYQLGGVSQGIADDYTSDTYFGHFQ